MKQDQDPVADALSLGVALSPTQADALLRFRELLETLGVSRGLVSSRDGGRVYERHILDSLRAATVLRPDQDEEAFDLGSGAGLPGIVLAIAHPRIHFRLIEPRRRRAAFIEYSVEQLALGNVAVEVGRAEDVEGQTADVVTARAFSSLGRAWPIAHALLRPGGRLVYFAGAGLADPAAAAARASEGHAATISVVRVLDSGGPLVIMARR